MVHALVGEGEGEADATGAGAADARVAGADLGGAGVAKTAAANGTDATRGTSTMGGIMHVDAPAERGRGGRVCEWIGW